MNEMRDVGDWESYRLSLPLPVLSFPVILERASRSCASAILLRGKGLDKVVPVVVVSVGLGPS
jgi:hypothetical protein